MTREEKRYFVAMEKSCKGVILKTIGELNRYLKSYAKTLFDKNQMHELWEREEHKILGLRGKNKNLRTLQGKIKNIKKSDKNRN